MRTVLIFENNDKNLPTGAEAYYEAIASQEEIYLEDREDEVRVILESDEAPPLLTENPDQQREHTAKDLITGDSHNSAHSEEAIEAMITMIIHRATRMASYL